MWASHLNSGFHGLKPCFRLSPTISLLPRMCPKPFWIKPAIICINRFGASLAYDTRNSTQLPNHGQRTEVDTEFSVGDSTFYKLELKSDWFFPGLFKGHVIEIGGRAGVADSLSSAATCRFTTVIILAAFIRCAASNTATSRRASHSIRQRPAWSEEPIGGDSYWFGSMEYSCRSLKKTPAWTCALRCFMTPVRWQWILIRFQARLTTTGASASG